MSIYIRLLKKLMVKDNFNKSKGKVFVGMSGGVDSSVSAALLIKEGYEVVGVFMKVWQPDFLPCTWENERRDAMRVTAHLGIPLLTWNFEKEYKENVADYMIREYRAGRTPNPDVMCNREIKFGAFFRRAVASGADFVATGHYAQVSKDKKAGSYKMLASVDETKDQSYFLWTLGQEQLSKTFFPIGKFKKSQVRTLAKKFDLPVAEKKDSQGLCFMGKLDMKEFLAHYLKESEGNVVNEKNEIMGTHRGSAFYTLGERHGFTILKKTTDQEPYYVIAKDLKANTITVGHLTTHRSLACAQKELQISQVHFCCNTTPDLSKTFTAQVRYHGEAYPCTISRDDKVSMLPRSSIPKSRDVQNLIIHFKKPVTIDCGQSVVLYDGIECVGGGVAE